MLRKARFGLGVLRSATHGHRLSRLALKPRTSYVASCAGGKLTCSVVANQRNFSAYTYLRQEKELTSEEEADGLPKGKPVDPRTGERRKGSNWSDQAELRALAQRLGHDVQALPSLQIALTHSSALGSSQKQEHNRRMSNLGEIVLKHYAHEYLYFRYPNLTAEGLYDLREFLTSQEISISIANYLGITDLIRCRYPLNLPRNLSIIQWAFYATEGALYIDVGPQAARKLVHDCVLPQLAGKDLHDIIKLQHPKFLLKTILSSQRQPSPISRLLRESGRMTHFPSFVVGVYSGDRLLAEGCGTSLKRAETEATVAALMKHFRVEVSQAPLPSDHEDFVNERTVQFSEGSEENLSQK